MTDFPEDDGGEKVSSPARCLSSRLLLPFTCRQIPPSLLLSFLFFPSSLSGISEKPLRYPVAITSVMPFAFNIPPSSSVCACLRVSPSWLVSCNKNLTVSSLTHSHPPSPRGKNTWRAAARARFRNGVKASPSSSSSLRGRTNGSLCNVYEMTE